MALECAQDSTNTKSLTDAFYGLLIADHGLEVELTGLVAKDDPYMARTSLALLLTSDSFRIVLKSQQTSFIEISFEKRFTQAINSIGWPADAFLTLLHHSDPMEIAHKTNAHGKTALHWAAAHLGEWLRRSGWPRHPEEKVEEYGKLVSRLIRMGADVHALWSTESRWNFRTFETWGLGKKDPLFIWRAS